MSYINPKTQVTDGTPHDKAPYDRNKLKPTYEELEQEIDRICQESAKQAYDNWMLRRELAKCTCKNKGNNDTK